MISEQEDSTHVLIAEDDDDDYLIFSLAIEEVTFRVMLTRAVNGEVLLHLLEEKLPDIVFLDLLMPCKDGRQCLKEIRANKKFDAVPVIIYSSLTDLMNVEYCYREGSNLFAVKPSRISELKTILERILTIDWKKTLYFPSRSEFVLAAG